MDGVHIYISSLGIWKLKADSEKKPTENTLYLNLLLAIAYLHCAEVRNTN